MLLLVTRDGALDLVWALDLAEPKYPVLAAAGPLELTAIEMRCSLSVLGLRAGTQTLQDEPRSRPVVPAPRRVSVSTVNGAEQTAWTQAAGLTENGELALRSLSLEGDNLCRLYNIPLEAEDISYMEAGTSSTAAFGLPLSDGSVFVGTLSGQFLRVTPGRRPQRLTNLSTTTPHHAAVSAPDGTIYLLGKNGELARGTPEGGFELLPQRGFGNVTEHLRSWGSGPGEDFEFFTASDGRAFEKFDGVQFTTLATAAKYVDEVGSRAGARPSVLRIGPDEALAALIDLQFGELFHYKNGVLTRERPFIDVDEEPIDFFYFDEYGVMLTSTEGRVVIRDAQGVWGESFAISRARVRALLPFQGRLFSYGVSGGFYQYHPVSGACPVTDPLTGGFVRFMLPFGGDEILMLEATFPPSRDDVRMTIVRKSGDLAPCLEDAGSQ